MKLGMLELLKKWANKLAAGLSDLRVAIILLLVIASSSGLGTAGFTASNWGDMFGVEQRVGAFLLGVSIIPFLLNMISSLAWVFGW